MPGLIQELLSLVLRQPLSLLLSSMVDLLPLLLLLLVLLLARIWGLSQSLIVKERARWEGRLIF